MSIHNPFPMVAIHCITYNQECYIRDTLEGFILQKTSFPFIAIVHDDASTDGTADIVREYAEKYPEIIKPIFETENQYSKHDGSLSRIMNKAVDDSGAKYVAYCEGDDYWIDPYKLQKQVDFLEANPNYSLVYTNNYERNGDSLSKEEFFIDSDKDVTVEDVIVNGGHFINTASIMLRHNTYQQYPTFTFFVGDYPLQIWMSMHGRVRKLSDVTCVYRLFSKGSWSKAHIKEKSKGKDYITAGEFEILDTMDEISNYKYHQYFKNRKVIYLFLNSLYSNISGDALHAIKMLLKNPSIIFYKKVRKELKRILCISNLKLLFKKLF